MIIFYIYYVVCVYIQIKPQRACDYIELIRRLLCNFLRCATTRRFSLNMWIGDRRQLRACHNSHTQARSTQVIGLGTYIFNTFLRFYYTKIRNEYAIGLRARRTYEIMLRARIHRLCASHTTHIHIDKHNKIHK